jgi:hypothetical protein
VWASFARSFFCFARALYQEYFSVTLSAAKSLGVVRFVRTTVLLSPRFFVALLLRMRFNTKPLF